MQSNSDGYRRVVVKVSGEALQGSASTGIDPAILTRTARDLVTVAERGLQLAVVVGGGNIFRGAALQEAGMDRVVGDHIGMLGTVMNGLALADAVRRQGRAAHVLSAVAIAGVADGYRRDAAVAAMAAGDIVVLAGGIGNPFFTTDTTACLRGIELGADVVIKATNVDGVYSADPRRDSTAQRFRTLSFDEAIARDLAVMDLPAISLCRDHGLAIRVFDIAAPGALLMLADGGDVGTLIAPRSQLDQSFQFA